MAGVCETCGGTGRRKTVPGEAVPAWVSADGRETFDVWPATVKCEQCAGQGVYVSLAEAGGRPEDAPAPNPPS